jgi:hypothetical protein
MEPELFSPKVNPNVSAMIIGISLFRFAPIEMTLRDCFALIEMTVCGWLFLTPLFFD